MRDLWRGTWATRIRIASGLVLMLYALLHFLNIGLGLFGPEAMDSFQHAREAVTRSVIGTILLYGALFAHMGLALWRLACRGTLRMPRWEATQTVLGLLIPLFLLKHVIFTRISNSFFDVNDEYSYLIGLIWNSTDGLLQNLLLLVVWLHGCIGLHFWLSGKRWWRDNLAALSALASLVPGFAIVGYIVEGRRISAVKSDPEMLEKLKVEWNWPSGETFHALIDVSETVWWTVAVLMGAALVAYLVRRQIQRKRSVRIRYVDGPEIRAPKGVTLLEMSRANNVPHTSLCGGRGRCTTCRVIVEEGGELLHPPSAAEERSLRAVGAPPNARLACQIRPTNPMTVFRVFQADGKHARAHASQGKEQELAVLFLDIRGFTARTTGQLPYDVVFLLNRFFDAVVPAVDNAGGTVDKYLGDGFLALFEISPPGASARAGLAAIQGIGEALERFNKVLEREGTPPVRIGLGLHLGDVVLGEIGASGNAPRTLIGDTVNAASRLESKTKELGVQALVSEAVLREAGYDTSDLDMPELDLRGVAETIRVLAVDRSADMAAILAQIPASQTPVAAE